MKLPSTKQLRKLAETANKEQADFKHKQELEEIALAQGIADEVMKGLPKKLGDAARNGDFELVVFQLKYLRDYKKLGFETTPPNVLTKQDLMGAGRILYLELEQAGLKPSLEFWYDDGGMDSGFNLVAHW